MIRICIDKRLKRVSQKSSQNNEFSLFRPVGKPYPDTRTHTKAYSHRSLAFLITGCLLAALSTGVQQSAAQTSPEAIRSYNQGIEAYEHQDIQAALRRFDRAIQLDPNYAAAYFNMGSIYYQLKQYGDAASMFQKAAELSPTDSQAKYNLALSLEKQMHYEEAVNVLRQIPVNDSKYAQARSKIDELRPPLKPGGSASSRPAPERPKPRQSQSHHPIGRLATRSFSKGYNGPTGIVIGPGGYMYVANYINNTIYRVGAGGEKSVFAQGDGLKGPIGLVYNPKTDDLYVANYLLNTVARITPQGKVSTMVSGLNKPYNLFLDTINNALYISEQDPSNVISRVTLPR